MLYILQPYAALPYGSLTLHLVVILSGLAYPIGCLLGMVWECRSVRTMNLLTLIGTVIGCYIIVCSLMSPNPPLKPLLKTLRKVEDKVQAHETQEILSLLINNYNLGGILMIIVWISFVMILSYCKAMICIWVCDYNGTNGMFWVGMWTQFGAAMGAGLNFILINYTTMFTE